MKKRLLALTLLFFSCSFIFIGEVYANSNPTFKLRILPKDCIFTVIDAGTQTLFFLTPKICEPPPPVNTSTSLELPLERLVTYEDASGRTTFTPPAKDTARVDNLAQDSLQLVRTTINSLIWAIGWTIIGLLWALLIFTLAFGLAGFRKFFATLGSLVHR